MYLLVYLSIRVSGLPKLSCRLASINSHDVSFRIVCKPEKLCSKFHHLYSRQMTAYSMIMTDDSFQLAAGCISMLNL
jgi:hypothetical protein